LYGGNFHGEPIAFAMYIIAMSLASENKTLYFLTSVDTIPYITTQKTAGIPKNSGCFDEQPFS
jgi:hypothetical protein